MYEEKLKNDLFYEVDKPKRGAQTYELADLTTRLFALFIDGFILSMIGGLSSAGARSFWGFGVGLLISVAYTWYFLTQHNGQTPGKMLLGIRVIKADGSRLMDKDAVIRYFGYYLNSLPFLFGLGWLWAIFDKNAQGFHDKLANTYVVKVFNAETK